MAWLIERAGSKVAHLSHGVDLLPLCGAENAAGKPYREVGIEESKRFVCTRCVSITTTLFDTWEARSEYIRWAAT